MASLLSFGGIKKKDNVLNTLSNYDVRTNNAVTNNANTSSIANRNQPAKVNNTSPTISQPKNTTSTLKTLSNLNARTPSFNTEVKQISPVKNTLNKLNQLNQSQNSFNTDANNNTNKLDFNQYKVAKTANTAINGNNTPFKTNTLNNANTISTVKNFFSKPQTQLTEQSIQKTADTLNKVRDSFKPSEEYTKTMNTAVGSTLSGKNPDVNFIGFADKAFKSTGNTFDNTSNYKTMLDAYNKASGNQQADIKKSINDQIINMRELAKQGNTTALKAVDYLTELGGALDRYGNYKGKSLGRQVWDELSTGGFIGDIGGNRLTQFLGNVFGKGDEVAAQLEKQANARDDLGAVGVVNDAAAGVGNFALNYGTAGAYGAANAGVGALNTMQGHNRKVMDYDENGNAYIRNKTDRERLGEWGQSALDAAFAAAGVAGVGPSLGTKALESGAKLGLRDIVKYAAAELPWAGATTYLQEGLGNLSQNRNFNDINAGQFAKDLALNLGQDIGMDVANYNIGKMGQRGADTRLNYDNSGNAVKTNPDGTTSRLSDSELAKAARENRVNNDFTPGIDRVTEAFNNSKNQEVIANRNGTEFSIGDFGNEALSRKSNQDGNHSLSKEDIAHVLGNSNRQSISGDSSFRKDNVAWFGDLPDGTRATVITRKNALGQEEVINAYKNNPGYEEKLISDFGTPAQSRTGNFGLEDHSIGSAIQGRRLSDSSEASKLHIDSSIPQTSKNYNTDNVNRSASDIIAERTFQNRQNNTPNRATNNLDTTELSSLAKRAENGDTEALRTLEELGLTPVTEESSDWRGKNVDEVINPEETDLGKTLETESKSERSEKVKQLKKRLDDMGARANSLFDPEVRAIKDEIQALEGGFNSVEDMYQQRADNRRTAEDQAETEREQRLAKNRNLEQSINSEEYMMSHRPDESGPTIDNIPEFADGKNFDKTNPLQQEAYNILQTIRNNPEAEISIYRATTGDSINEGDWVTLTKGYAEEHLRHSLQDDPNAKIIEKKVQAKDVRWAGDSIDEYGYFPNQSEGRNSTLDTNAKNNSIDQDTAQQILSSWREKQNQPQVATGTEPLSYAEDGTPEFVNRYTSQTKLDSSVDNSKVARKNRFNQFVASLKDSDNPIVQKFYDLAVGNRKKATIASLSESEANRYREAGLDIKDNARFNLTRNAILHEDNSGHLTGIRINPDGKTGIEIDANPLKKSNIVSLDEVVKKPDVIKSGGMGRNGQRLIVEKQINDRLRIVIEAVNDGNELNSVSIYKQNKTPLTESSTDSQITPQSGMSAQLNPLGYTQRANSSDINIIPQTTENGNSTSSRFSKNTSQNQAFSTETREALKSDPLGYTPTTNAERLARANEIISTKSTDEVDTYLRDNFFNVKDKNRNSGDVVLAGEFAKMLDAKGQYDRSTEIINKMSAIASRQGQEIQALSLMMNRSPEGIANMAQSAIKKGGGDMTGELRGKIVKKTEEIGRIRAEKNNLTLESNRIGEQIMNGEGDLPALRKRQMEIAQEYRQNMDAEGRTFSELSDIVSKNSPDNRSIFGSVYRASLLSGPRTHTGNLVSNTFQNVSLKSIVKSKSPKQR